MRGFAIALTALVLFPLAANAEAWDVHLDDQRNGLVLLGMPDEPENDTDLWILCRKDGRFDVGAGANDGIGKGKGEHVSATFAAGGKTAVLHGVSRESVNFQMTGGTELVTTIARDDALFAVLAAGKPIKMGRTTFAAPGAALSKFLAGCPAKK